MSTPIVEHIRIGIDCRLGGLTHAGIGRYISELLKELTPLSADFTWVLIVQSAAQGAELLAYISQEAQESCELCVAAVRPYSLAEQLVLPFHLHTLKLHLLHVPHFNVPLLYFGRTVITIHDLLWHEQKGLAVTTLNPATYWIKYVLYRIVVWWALFRASHIFVPSEFVKKTVLKFYPTLKKERISITYESIGSQLVAAAKNQKATQVEPNTLLYVGSLYPHKNVSLIIAALRQLPLYTLKIVGSRSIFLAAIQDEIKKHSVEQQVKFLGKLSDTELAAAYAQAQCLVQPSFSEGFGLTGLEAMAFQTPVLASDIPVFHEIYQGAAVYFDPKSVDSLLAALHTLEDPKLRSDQVRAGQKVALQYSWKKLAQQTYHAYRSVLNI